MYITPPLEPTTYTLESAAQALGHSSPYRRREAVEALGTMGDGGDLLFQALEDPNPWVRGAIAVAARRLPLTDAAGLVSVLLGDRNPNVVVDALETVGSLGLSQFGAQVLVVAQSPDQRVKAAAIRALGFLGSPETETIVITVLTDPLTRTEPKVRIRASEVARAVGSPALAAPLQAALADELSRPEPHENLVTSLCQGLVACDTLGVSGETLMTAVDRVPSLQSTVCKALARMKFEPSRTLFEQFATDSDDEKRALGVRSLGTLGAGPSFAVLVNAASDTNSTVQSAALRALGEIDVEGLGDANTQELIEISTRLCLDAVGVLRSMAAHGGVPAPLQAYAIKSLATVTAVVTDPPPTAV